MSKMDDALSIISDGLSAVTEGCKLPVRMKNTEDWPKAEVISIRQIKGRYFLSKRNNIESNDKRYYIKT